MANAGYDQFCLRGTVPRKQKSLALLCERFCLMHAGERAGTLVSLDTCAVSLGSERRRLYDLLGVLVSVGVVTRGRKNAFQWCGTANMGFFLAGVQAQGAPCTVPATDAAPAPDSQDEEGRKNSGLLALSNNFLRLYMTAGTPLSLEDAGARIGGLESVGVESSKAKVRRLYDIANVLISLGLMEKTSVPDARGRTAYRWVGALAPGNGQQRAPAANATGAAATASEQAAAGTDRKRMALTAGAIAMAPVTVLPKRPRRAARPTAFVDGDAAFDADTGGELPASAPGARAAAPSPVRHRQSAHARPPAVAVVSAPPIGSAVAWQYANGANDAVLSRFALMARAVVSTPAAQGALH
jgi:E2F/DP family winged-helix DNA-binding domain